ncbi:MAG: T9SS type A sorting domain-containing protein [Winogradskyella sp.]|nr:T9SS type A sorting domain-containing protein [Winogradskyella sp.]
MKAFFLSILLLCVFKISDAQIVNIPDANFKNALLNHDPIIDINDDGEIQVSEAELVTEINVSSTSISSIQGLEAFVNLVELELSSLNINDLVIGNLPNLESLHIFSFYAYSLALNNLPSLNELNVGSNQNEFFNTIDFNNCNNLEVLILTDTFFISSLDLSQLVNLKEIHLYALSYLENLDISNNIYIEVFNLSATGITQLDFSNQPNLESLGVYWQGLNYLDISSNSNLIDLQIDGGNFDNLDLSQKPNLNVLYLGAITAEWINLKNGYTPNQWFNVSAYINVDYICADESDIEILENLNLIYNPVINSYCSFTPGGEYYTIEGESRIDSNTNGCDVGDNFYPNIKLELTDGTNNGTYFADTSGSYAVPVSEGTHTINPVLENTDYFTVSPNVATVTFPDDGNPYVQDFCLIPDGVHNDVEVIIVPTSQAVPGFDSYYKILYRNKGNTTLSGSISFDFEDDFMDFLSATPTEDINAIGNLQWNYTNLQPFETREIEVVFNLNTPTDSNFPLNDGDELDFEVTIDPILNDETASDNSFGLKQIVVNSYDPNDVKCLEGVAILPEHVGEYVHYRIRFENLGTANATNVVVKDVIDEAKFDVSTLIPLHASHNYTTRIREGNIVEFIFEGINLPFDDANNDGYVVFKIKTLDSLQLGDTFTNQAEIYFDFNFPVITNMYSTSVQENLSVNDFELNDVVLFPNPVNNQLYIKSKLNIDTIKIFDINGRLIQNKTMNDSNVQNEVSVSALKSGVYFIEVYSNRQKEVLKFIKE